MAMAKHTKPCPCEDCEIDRLRADIARLTASMTAAEGERDEERADRIHVAGLLVAVEAERDILRDERDGFEEACKNLAAERDSLAARVAGPIGDVLRERQRQDAKWGEQNHPDGTGPDECPRFFLPSADVARKLCDREHHSGNGTWAHIAVEELCEAVECGDATDLRKELVQTAAVLVAWVEAIDRRAIRAALEGAK